MHGSRRSVTSRVRSQRRVTRPNYRFSHLYDLREYVVTRFNYRGGTREESSTLYGLARRKIRYVNDTFFSRAGFPLIVVSHVYRREPTRTTSSATTRRYGSLARSVGTRTPTIQYGKRGRRRSMHRHASS